MGRLIRAPLALVLAGSAALVAGGPVAAFDGFGETDADAIYGEELRFEVALRGDAPERLELVLRFEGDDADFIQPVEPVGRRAEFVWDAGGKYITPSTEIRYRWRAIDGERVVESAESMIVYDDDRLGLDWQRERMGEATVHWYGESAGIARRFGELTAERTARTEELLGFELAGPIDIFVYDTQADFFGALGPGAREWTGAAAYPHLRAVFMWLEGGSITYLETAVVHEVTHIVFNDATDNPYHEPARWLNEGIATWSETEDADGERGIVELEARGGGLLAFAAIADQFPIGDRRARLSYAQGTTMVDLIVGRHGEEALARMTAAYRDGASDEEALQAGTGQTADALYEAFFAEFGVEQPQPIEPEPLLPSNVERPGGGALPPATAPPVPTGDEQPQPSPAEPDPVDGTLVLVALGVAGMAAAGAAIWVMRRAARRGEGGG